MTEPLKEIRNKIRENFGTHGLKRFLDELADDDVSNYVLARRWKLSLWNVRLARSNFPKLYRMAFPPALRKARILSFIQRRA